MRKVIVMGRRAPGRTRAAGHAHMRSIHAGLVLLPPEDAGSMPADYTQNHVFDGVYPSAGAHAIERDLFTEIWPAAAGPRAVTPYFRDKLQPDEENFVDNETVQKVFCDAQPLKAGPQGDFKVFLAFTGGDPTAAIAVVENALSSAQNRAVPGPSGDPAFVDNVVEFWFAERADAAGVLERWPAVLAATRADPATSFAVAAEQFDSARLRALLKDSVV